MKLEGKVRGWGAAVLVLAVAGIARADGPRDEVEVSACDITVAVSEPACGAAEPTELGELFRQIADRIEALEAQVAYAVATAEGARAQTVPAAISAVGVGACESAVPVSIPADDTLLASMVEAEVRLTEVNERIAALEAREREILGRIEESLAAADASRGEMVTDLQNRTLQLKDMWIRQEGRVDMAAMVGGFRDTLLSMNLPQVMGGMVAFAENFDRMADTGMRPVLEEWSARTESMHLGAGLVDTGRQLEGVTLGHLLLSMADQTEGAPMPAELAQGIKMAQGFGAQNFMPMLKSNFGRVSLGALLQPLAAQMESVTPAMFFYDLADQMPGRVLPAVAIGLGDALEGMDLASFFRILSEELAPIDGRTLLLGVDKLLRGEPPSVVLRAVGEKLTDIDVGRLMVRLGGTLEEASVSNVLFRMSEEMGDITVSDALAEVQMGVDAIGIPVNLPVFLKHSGDHLARMNMPQRMEGFQGMVDQLAAYTGEVRRELGLYPHGEPDFWIEDAQPATPVQLDEIVEEVLENPVLDGDRVEQTEENAELARLRQALADLEAAGLADDHPAVTKLRAQLAEAMQGIAGGQ